MKDLYGISGFGNYSHEFDWDDGFCINEKSLYLVSDEEIGSLDLPVQAWLAWDEKYPGFVHTWSVVEHGGSRNGWLYVFAESSEKALELFKQAAADLYPEKAYEEDR